MKAGRRAVGAILAGLVVLAGAACGDSDDATTVLQLSLADVVGGWDVRLTETSDTCGFPGAAGPIAQAWRIEEEAGEPIVTVAFNGSCRTRVYTFDGNTLTRESTGLFLDFQGNDCRARLEIRETLVFDGGTFVGESRGTYSYDSGSCQRAYPCVQVFELSGTPCDDCAGDC